MGIAEKTLKTLLYGCFFVLSSVTAFAQSTDQNFPTAVTTNEIDGAIRARDMGDARLTSYFYAFDGGQGDMFINVVTKNFTGDIDVFTIDAMTPLTKMVIYSEGEASETGRLVYLRKPERLILRVQGRTPNDDPANFRIKFGGSFIALAPQKVQEAPTVAKAAPDEPGVRVNSTGRIVAVIPKPQPTPRVVEPPPVKEPVARSRPVVKPVDTERAKTTPPVSTKKPRDAGTVFENDTSKVTVEEAKPAEREPSNAKPAVKTPVRKPVAGRGAPATERVARDVPKPTVRKPEPEPKTADPLASVRLVIQMKDGTTFWMPMNEVLRFTVDKGTMTVVGKNGSITRYNILDVEKTTIQ